MSRRDRERSSEAHRIGLSNRLREERQVAQHFPTRARIGSAPAPSDGASAVPSGDLTWRDERERRNPHLETAMSAAPIITAKAIHATATVMMSHHNRP
jgi:hypothetical protein